MKIQGARTAVNQGDTKHHDRRGSRAQNQVFDAGFQRTQPVPFKAGQHIKCNGDQFHRHKQQHQTIGTGGKGHARQGKAGECVQFRNARPNSLRIALGQQHHQHGRQHKVTLEINRQAIFHIARGPRAGTLIENGEAVAKHCDQSAGHPPAQLRLALGRRPEIHQQYHNAQ